MKNYEHTQPGTLLRITLSAIAIGVAASGVVLLIQETDRESGVLMLVVSLVPLIFLGLFHSLNVRLSKRDVFFSFGPGLIRRTISFDDIGSAAAVRNHWYNGWGIKKIRGGWLCNVSGFDAVELTRKNGRKTRIGTDEPKKLLAAIEAGLARSGE